MDTKIETNKEPVFANPDFPQLLTRRETELLTWMAAGKSNHDAAGLLYISTNTIRYHLKNIYKKLNVTNKAAAVSTATAMGLIVASGSGNKKLVQQVYNAFVEGNVRHS